MELPKSVLCLWLTSFGAVALPMHSPVPGGVAVIELPQEVSAVYYQNKSVRIEWDQKKPFAIVGLGLNEQPGEHKLELLAREQKTEYKFTINPKEYPKQSITIKKKKYVQPNLKLQARIKRERALLQEVVAFWEPRSFSSSQFLIPVTGPVSGPFGTKRILNGQPKSSHRGLDLAAPKGHTVSAAQTGIVRMVANLFYTGNTIVIEHGHGLKTLYCHLDETTVKTGDSVNKGQEVGKVGQTGRATGPHLHFGVTLNEQRVDPSLFFES